MKKLASIALGLGLVGLSSSASAQTTGTFGESGTLAIHAATGAPMISSGFGLVSAGATPTLGLQTNRFGTENCNPGPGGTQVCTESTTSITSFYVNPRIHYFVIDNLSIGGEALIATFSGSVKTVSGGTTVERDLDDTPTAFGLMPIVGYNIALGERFSLWPQGGIGFRRVSSEDLNDLNDANDDVENRETWWFFNADVPFMLHIAPHFALGAGPGVTVTLSQSRSSESRGVTVTQDGFSTTQFRWFNAHLVGWF